MCLLFQSQPRNILTRCRSIKRVIFESTWKNNGTKLVPLQISEIKQIAGRAGRYKTAGEAIAQDEAQRSAPETIADPVIGIDDTPQVIPENTAIGYATTLDQIEFSGLKKGMEREAEIITTAGLFPPSLIVERFANYFPPGTPFSYIMLRLHDITNIHPRFHLCALKDQLAIADAIHLIKNLSIQDRIMLCSAPSNMRDPGEKAFLKELALCIAENNSGELLDIPNLPLEILDQKPSADRDYLRKLESLHKMLVLYLWLSFRFPNVFTSRKLTNHVTKLVEEKIEHTLGHFSFTERARAGMLKMRKRAIRQSEQSGEGDPSGETDKPLSNVGVVAADDTPRAVRDILSDTRSFSDDTATPSDDIHEYPTPELEELESNEVEESAEEDAAEEKNGERTAEVSPQVDELTKKGPLHIERPDATQPRI